MAEEITKFRLDDETAWSGLAHKLAPSFEAGDCVFLVGNLGVGKTSFARALIRCLLQDKEAEVPSPTFSLVQIYEGSDYPIWHMDLYRLEDPEEIFELGVEEAFDEALCIIEWPEKAQGLLPENALVISIKIENDKKRIASLKAAKDSGWLTRF